MIRGGIKGGIIDKSIIVGQFIIILFLLGKVYNRQYVVKFVDLSSGMNDEKTKASDLNSRYWDCEYKNITMYSYPTDIVFLGDSLTYRCQWNELFPELSVKNRGIPSDTSEGVLARLDSVEKTKPRKIFLMIGINDIAKGVEKEKMIENYEKIINELVSADSELYVQSVLPVAKDVGELKLKTINEEVQWINKEIEKLCGENQIEYINLNEKFKNERGCMDSQYVMGDGVHLNAMGYQVWKECIDSYVYQ